MGIPASGEQWTIRHGSQEATVVQVGGGLRTYTVDGLDVLAGYGPDEMAASGRGQLLMPWPNRIRDGKYSFDGKERQLSITEVPLHNASHGLVRWAQWELVRVQAGESAVTVRHRLLPQPGWEGILLLVVDYYLGETGLQVSTSATNVGDARVPFGYGAHPYLAIGDTPLADVELTLPADTEVLVDDRSIPTGTEAVRPETDFRQGRRLGDVRLDTAYTDLARDADGRWRVTLSGLANRPPVTLWGDEAFGWTQVFTAKGEDDFTGGVRGIAVEPMSCPANAFNSGDGLVVLEPGQSWTGTWGISPSAG
ncbi:MAG TPA: aldose 1-epimerase family protein [Pedococcus sp.]